MFDIGGDVKGVPFQGAPLLALSAVLRATPIRQGHDRCRHLMRCSQEARIFVLEAKGYETSRRTLLLPSVPVLVCTVIALDQYRLVNNLLR